MSRKLKKTTLGLKDYMYISTVEDRIEIEMADYVDSLRDIKEIRKAKEDDDLTKQEIKEYRKVTGKLSWLEK